MKKIFTKITFLLLVFFAIFVLRTRKMQIIFSSYPSVDILYDDNRQNISKVKKELYDLAKDNDSLIGKRIVDNLDKNKRFFVYEKFGSARLDKYLPEANDEQIANSDLSGSYIIVSGNLSVDLLEDKLKSLGLSTKIYPQYSSLEYISSFFSSLSELILICLFFISYLVLLVIERINIMKESAIRMISGFSLKKIMSHLLLEDFKDLILSFALAFLLASILLIFNELFIGVFLKIIALILILYLIFLFLISIIVSIFFYLIIKRTKLYLLLKGRLPLKKLFILIMACQFIVFISLGFSISHSTNSYRMLDTLKKASPYWDKLADNFSFDDNIGSFARNNKEENAKREKLWYEFLDEQIRDDKAFFVDNNLIPSLFQSKYQKDDFDKDYSIRGNVLFVSDNYLLDKDNLIGLYLDKPLDKDSYAIFIPDKLGDDYDLENYYKEKISEKFDIKLEDVKLRTYKYPAGKNIFAFNNKIINRPQFLYDPIVFSISLKSTGPSIVANRFWLSKKNNFIFRDYDDTITSMKDYGLLKWVGAFNDANNKYLDLANQISLSYKETLFASILASLIAYLLYYRLIFIYFKEFRREILIKKISGLSFFDIHRKFIGINIGLLIISLIINTYLKLSILNAGILFILGLIIFYINICLQEKREKNMSVSIIKGE